MIVVSVYLGAKFLKICNEIVDLYKIADNNEKKELINCVLQNLSMDGEKLSYIYKRPFDIFAKGLSCTKKPMVLAILEQS